MSENTKKIIEAITPILKRAGVIRSDLFGSYAKGNDNAESDVDILVDFPKEKSLLDFADLKVKLEEELNKEVDLVEYDSVKPIIRNFVFNNLIKVL
mgnify:CR=1 FL=1